MFSVRIFQKEGGSEAFFLEFTSTVFLRIFKKIIVVPIVEILTSKLSYRSKFAVHSQQNRAYQGFITLYIDLVETQIHSQIKTTMAKQLHCFEKDRKASRLKRLRNRCDQKKCTVIFIYSFRT